MVGPINPFSYLPVATCASRQTSPRKISIRFWFTGWWLKNKKNFVQPLRTRYSPRAGRPTPSIANDSRLHLAWARRAAQRGGWRGHPAIAHASRVVVSTVRRADRVRTHRPCGQCGQFFGRCSCGQCGQFVFDCPHCPQSDRRGHLWAMWAMWSRKKNRSAPNEMRPTRSKLYVYTVVFLY